MRRLVNYVFAIWFLYYEVAWAAGSFASQAFRTVAPMVAKKAHFLARNGHLACKSPSNREYHATGPLEKGMFVRGGPGTGAPIDKSVKKERHDPSRVRVVREFRWNYNAPPIHDAGDFSSVVVPSVVGLAIGLYAIDEELRISSELYEGIECHDARSLNDLKTGQFSRRQVNDLFIRAVKRNDRLLVGLVRKYQWRRIRLGDKSLYGKEFLEDCRRNGFEDIAAGVEFVHGIREGEEEL